MQWVEIRGRPIPAVTLGPEQVLILRGKEFTCQYIDLYYLNKIYSVWVRVSYVQNIFKTQSLQSSLRRGIQTKISNRGRICYSLNVIGQNDISELKHN